MSYPRPKNGYHRMTDAALLEKAYYIHSQVSSNTTEFPLPKPTMIVFSDACDAFFAAIQAAASGDRNAVNAKNTARETLIDLLYQLSYYVFNISGGDLDMIELAGFTAAKEPVPAPELTQPTGLKVENSSQTGELIASLKKVKGAASYVYQYTTDPLLKEESWMSMICTSTKCKISGLTPGTKYSLRVGAIGTKDQVMYSDVVSRFAA